MSTSTRNEGGRAGDGARGPTARPRRRHAIPFVTAMAVAAVALVVRTQHLGKISYWFDESFTWRTISFPWSEVVERVARDNQPPLYYLLLKAWAGIWGDSPLALRGFSAVAGLLTVGFTYLFVREAYQPPTDVEQADHEQADHEQADREQANREQAAFAGRAALLAATLLALSAFQVQWALQARMYSLLAALAAMSSWLMVRALARPGSLARWAAFTLAAAAVGYTHYYGLFAVAAQFVFLFALAGWRRLAANRAPEFRYVIAAAAGVWLMWAPWAPVFLRQLRQVHAGFWIRPVDWRILATTMYQMFSFSQYDGASDGVLLGVLELCVLLLAALVAWRASAIDWYVALAAVLPIVASVAASWLGVRVFDTHYFVAAQLFFVVAAAALVGRLRAAAIRRLMIAGLVAGSAALCVMHWRMRDHLAERPGALGAVAWLDGARKPGEPVIVCSPMIATTIAAHAASPGPIYVFRWPQFGYRHFHGTAVFDESDYVAAADLPGLAGDWVWAVDTDGWDNGSFTVPMPAPWALRVEERFKEIYGNEYDLVVRLYQREPAGKGVDSPRRHREHGE
ncbi:MAG TPA: glycosyltransferase family 39 protein [Pirellulales bacterium]|nr:glycosyltransferase family 39 protein [Pirellulales bacterium]